MDIKKIAMDNFHEFIDTIQDQIQLTEEEFQTIDFVVDCVNSHNALVETLKNVRCYLRDSNINSEGLADVIIEIDKALKQAEG